MQHLGLPATDQERLRCFYEHYFGFFFVSTHYASRRRMSVLPVGT
jgi:hypothetical protein